MVKVWVHPQGAPIGSYRNIYWDAVQLIRAAVKSANSAVVGSNGLTLISDVNQLEKGDVSTIYTPYMCFESGAHPDQQARVRARKSDTPLQYFKQQSKKNKVRILFYRVTYNAEDSLDNKISAETTAHCRQEELEHSPVGSIAELWSCGGPSAGEANRHE